MPLYEYRCSSCGKTFELRLRITEDSTSPVLCSCGSEADRVYSAPAISFKGSGFYDTDYKQKKHHGAKEDHSTPQETKEKADAGQSSTSDKST
jgi:putative FmdB family regulatory protein